jgi:hypothetical protein
MMTIGPFSILGLGLVLLGALGVLYSLHRVTRPRVGRHPGRSRLERRLGLGHRDRRLLRRLARAGNLEDRTSLLIGRGCFEDAVLLLAPRERLLPRIESLREAIFDDRPSSGADH